MQSHHQSCQHQHDYFVDGRNNFWPCCDSLFCEHRWKPK